MKRLLATAALLLAGCVQSGTPAGGNAGHCVAVADLPAQPAKASDRVTGDSATDARILAQSLADWQEYDQLLTATLERTCASNGGVAECPDLTKIPPRPNPIQDHLTGHGVDDSLLIAAAIRAWQIHSGAVRDAIPVCRARS